jgi:hypothetical protein
MLDVSVSYNRYKFLGHEFLSWLWFAIENDPSQIAATAQEALSLEIGNRIVLENETGGALETITIKGDEAGMEEGLLALRKGAVVTELNLGMKFGEQEWRFTLIGESLCFSGLKTPEVRLLETKEDLEGALIEKAALCQQAVDTLTRFYAHFVKLRTSDDWEQRVVPAIRGWLKN